MIKHASILFSLCCLVAALAGAAPTPGGLVVTAQNIYGDGDCMSFGGGNATLRYTVENPTDSPHTLELALPLCRGYGLRKDAARLCVSATCAVAPRATATLDLRVPCAGAIAFARHPEGDAGCAVTLADDCGTCTTDDMELLAAGTGGDTARIFSPPSAVAAGDERRPASLHIAATPRTAETLKELAGFDALATPSFAGFTRWQDFSVYEAFAADAEDWRELPESFKAILADWVAAGGVLLALDEDAAGDFAPGGFALGCVVRMARGDAAAPDEKDRDAFVQAASQALANAAAMRELAASPLDCDIKASDAVLALRTETPFVPAIAILAAFCILAGPVLVAILARCNKRLSLLWVFPALAIVFSLAVAGAIVFTKGIEPELHQFAHTVFDGRAGKVATVCNHVILAPTPLKSDIRLNARDAVVSVHAGDDAAGEGEIVIDGDYFVFRGDWAPAMWPVVFRTVAVRDIAASAADEPAAPLAIPLTCRLQEHSAAVSEERRTGE